MSAPSTIAPLPVAIATDSEVDRVICHCFKVTESAVKNVIDVFQATEVEHVTELTSAGGGCRACHCRIDRLIAGLPAECGRLCEILERCERQSVTPADAVRPGFAFRID